MSDSHTSDRKLITGDYPALEEAFLFEVGQLRKDDPLTPVVVLVTSHLLGLHLARRLADRGHAHMNVRFMTLEDLANGVAARVLAAAGKEIVPDLVPQRLISMIAGELSSTDEGFYFKSIADRSGFHEALLATIEDLKNAGLSPHDLAGHLNSAGFAKGVNQKKIRDFLEIWTRYEAGLAGHGWYDTHDLMRAAGDLLTSSAIMKGIPALLVYGFYDFNALERNLLEAAIEAKPATLLVPFEATRAYEFVKPTLAWLAALGFAAIPKEPPASERQKPAVLRCLSENLFAGGRAIGSEEGALSVISAPGQLREIRESLRLILRHCAGDAHGLSGCAVVLRQPDVYAAIVRDQAENLGLTPYIPEGPRLADTRAGRSLLLMTDTLAHDFAREAVTEFTSFAKLKIPLPPGESSANLPAAWDVISMEAGVVGGREEWSDRLEALLADITPEEDDDEPGWRRVVPGGVRAVAALREFIGVLVPGLSKVEKEETWKGMTEKLKAVYTGLVEDDECAEIVLESLNNLGSLDRINSPASLEDYLRTLRDLLETSRLDQPSRFQRNGPAVLGLMAARGLPFETVVLPGLMEKGFPPIIRQDAILLDHERQALNLAVSGTSMAPISLKAKRRLEEERLLYRLAAGAATQKLILTYPRIEMLDAKERLPSSFLLATIEAVTGAKPDFTGFEAFNGLTRIPLSRIAVEDPTTALDDVEFDLSATCRDIGKKESAVIPILGELAPIFRCALDLESERWGSRAFTRYDGLMTSGEARKDLKSKYPIGSGEVSPSGLETYAACPYQFLLGRVMRIRRLVEPERTHELNPLDRGELVHRILWRFLTELSSERGPDLVIYDDDRALLHAVAGEEFDRFEKRGITGFPALWSLEKVRILGWLDDFLSDEVKETQFHPAYFEVRYGMKPHDPYESPISTTDPVPLTLGNRHILLRGRIDRIDISSDGSAARIIDYKTGDPDRKRENDFRGGKSLQLPLYLYAAGHLLRESHAAAEPVYAEYYHLKKPAKNRVRFDAETLGRKAVELETIISTIATSINEGRFFARPGTHCRLCDFKDICGPMKETIFEIKSGDPSVQEYLALSLVNDTDNNRGSTP